MTGHCFRMAGYASLCGMLLLFLVPMHPVAELQPVLRVPQDYPTIQAAVDAAPEGATILIGPGTYTENIVITKSLTLEGSGIDSTILRPPVSPQVDLENSVLVVQAPGHAVTLRVRQLAVRSQAQAYGGYEGIGIQVLTDASLVLERSAWVDLRVIISAAGPLQRLEVRDSLFEHNYAFISATPEGAFVIDEVILERNRFTRGTTVSIYDRIWVAGQHLISYDNTVICDPKLSLLVPHFRVGMAFEVMEGGQVEIARNFVALCENGVVVGQGVREARMAIRDNWLFSNNHNLVIESSPNYLAEGGVVHPRLDWFIEGNTIVGGGIGIKAGISNVEGGRVRLFKNWIAWQRKQYMGIITPPDISLFGNGILLSKSLRRESLKEPVKIEISENRIENNEAWGLALNLLPGWDGRPDECNVYAPGEEQVFTDPEIIGSGNIFRNNGKGDLCPADYPWPPGFRK